MIKYKILLIQGLIILFSGFLNAQFVVVDMTIDTELMRDDTKKELVNSLEEQITTYFLDTEFAPDAMDIEMVIEAHFMLEGIIDQGNDQVVKAQAVFSNKLDQQYFAKGVDFPYSKGQAINFTPIYEPLTGLLDYYAFMIIAGELDTYDHLSGTAYYNRALKVANEGRSFLYSRGWETRFKKCNDLKDNVYLREAKLHFYIALDVTYKPKAKKKELIKPLKLFIEKIEEVDYYYGSDRNTSQFLKSHADELGKLFQLAELFDDLEYLIEFDSDNKEIYRQYLPEKK